MNEFKISIVGRARVGKSLLLTRFVKHREDIISLSRSGADATKVPSELILEDGNSDTKIVCHWKDKDKKTEDVPVSELEEFHEKIRNKPKLQDEISHITINTQPSEWVSRVLKKTNVNRLILVDTEGISGDVKELNIRDWKVNLFILMFRSDNKEEFAESIRKMKPALLGNDIWYGVSLSDTTLSTTEEFNDLEEEAEDIKEAFSNELSELEDEKSLLNMRLSDLYKKDTILAIPNIKLKGDQYKMGRNYTDEKLEELLSSALKDKHCDINIGIDKNDKINNMAASNLIQYMSDTALYALKNEEIKDIKPEFKEAAFNKHLNDEHRLKSYDNGYLVEKQWEITSLLRNKIYDKLNEIKADINSPLSLGQQVALAQKFYKEFSKKIIWTNFFVSSKDGREGTEQASIILMLHSSEIAKELRANTPMDEILGKVIKVDKEWSKNSLIDPNKDSYIYTPIFLADKVNSISDEFDKFYKLVIRPYSVYAINHTSFKMGYKKANDVIGNY